MPINLGLRLRRETQAGPWHLPLGLSLVLSYILPPRNNHYSKYWGLYSLAFQKTVLFNMYVELNNILLRFLIFGNVIKIVITLMPVTNFHPILCFQDSFPLLHVNVFYSFPLLYSRPFVEMHHVFKNLLIKLKTMFLSNKHNVALNIWVYFLSFLCVTISFGYTHTS